MVAHLFHGERTDWFPRVQIILSKGESETFPIFEREAHLTESRSMSELLAEFADRRAVSLSKLQALNLTPQNLTRCGRHPVLAASRSLSCSLLGLGTTSLISIKSRAFWLRSIEKLLVLGNATSA